ncbi:MAG TPA: FtsX-like permease family protein, partial [Candidatus Latescibacteria bacterium]|nr:FtsX-like permease family protein [Candidatus Latescibacterota bacterium]
IGDSMPGAEVLTGGLDSSLEELSRKSFFSKIPLLMLLTVMVSTVLFYLAMTVAYLVQKREGDLALLKTRGVGTIHMLRLYGLEATLITLVAVIIAPFLALGAVALAGKLPYFAESTGGSTLPVQLSPDPFLAALGAGALCLAILIVPPLLGARGGLIVHKLRASRPPDVPFIHRYYIDLALLIIGGLLFWEFQSRGQFVSGGLFKDVQVNETLLIAPVLFLLVVALIFMRIFPLLVRFASGEAPTLVHLVAAAALVALAPLEAARQLDQADAPQAGVAIAILAAVAAFYWAAQRSTRPRSRLVFIILQAAAVAAFIAFSPLDSDELTFLPSLALLAIVPLQVAFLAAKLIARTAPVWLSMSLWRMARNPLQYTWLIVLLLLATGLAVLSTTVGGSLDKSQRDRIL